MASVWEHLGELANVGQLANVNAVSLISMIVKAATTARMHKKNCRQFAQHLKLIGNLLEQLNISELKKYPETAEPIEGLEDALRRSYILVHSCQDRSYLYLFAMGWNIVYQFRRAQNEIDRYLKIVPLISLVDNHRVRDRLEYIDKDQHEYTFDEEDRKVQGALLNPDDYNARVNVLKKTLSCTYPNMPFEQALQTENEKLQLELQRSQSSMDFGQCEVIQHLLGITEAMASSLPENTVQLTNFEKPQPDYVSEKQQSYDANYAGKQDDNHMASRSPSTASSGRELISNNGSGRHEEWNSDLLGCCSEPSLCFQTFFYPCGTFSRISTVANGRYVSSAEACNDLMAFSLILSCCCYTCCVRQKLRRMLSIRGGFCDDFLSHLMCCCCALVQEWREVEYRRVYGAKDTKTTAPPSQYMEFQN